MEESALSQKPSKAKRCVLELKECGHCNATLSVKCSKARTGGGAMRRREGQFHRAAIGARRVTSELEGEGPQR